MTSIIRGHCCHVQSLISVAPSTLRVVMAKEKGYISGQRVETLRGGNKVNAWGRKTGRGCWLTEDRGERSLKFFFSFCRAGTVSHLLISLFWSRLGSGGVGGEADCVWVGSFGERGGGRTEISIKVQL